VCAEIRKYFICMTDAHSALLHNNCLVCRSSSFVKITLPVRFPLVMSLGEDVVPHTAYTSLSTSPSAQSPHAASGVRHSNSKDKKNEEKEDFISLTDKCSDVVSRIKKSAAFYLAETQGQRQGHGQEGSAEASDQSSWEGPVKISRKDRGELFSYSAESLLGDMRSGDGEMQMDVEIGVETGVEAVIVSGAGTGTGTGVIAIDQDEATVSAGHRCTSPFYSTTPTDALRAGLTPQTGTLDPSPLRYRLNAVVRHIGSDAFTGHYICDTAAHEAPATLHSSTDRLVDGNEDESACSRRSNGATWSRNNDSLVNSVDEEIVLSEMDTPYIFFYTRIV
jgi:Ubiquitin carboxyl-terminal hydrolase